MKLKLFLFLAGVGLVYLVDPVRGKARRAALVRAFEPARTLLGGAQAVELKTLPHAGTAPSTGASALPAPASPVQSSNGTGAQPSSLSAYRTAGDRRTAGNGSTEQPTGHTVTDYREEVTPKPVFDPIPEGEANDPTLVARVESELFRDETLPKGKLNIDAANGVVTLRGTLDDAALAEDIVTRVRAIDGVSSVVDLLQRRPQE